MSTAVAPPTAAPLPPMVDRDPSPKSYPTLAPISTAQSSSSGPSRGPAPNDAAEKTTPTDGKRSPNTSRSGGPLSKISIKKEPPSSPSLQAGSRPRPRKLDLSATTNLQAGTRAPLTAREGGLGIQDVGLACLSPGFQTQDPALREQLQRSISVRDQQRSIIESRLQKSAKGDGSDALRPSESNLFGSQKSATKKRPAGLSIVPPSASQFANERVIQSAPLNQTFTGRRQPLPPSRHFANNLPSDFTSSPQIHHTPATQTNNRLPPISDVFGGDPLGPRDRDRDGNGVGNGRPNFGPSSQPNNLAPIPSPGLPSIQSNNGPPERPREYRSAEEAVHELAGGREELLPRIVHYSNRPNSPRSPPGVHSGSGSSTGAPNGVPQPTSAAPTSHLPPQTSLPHHAGSSRRRTRHEYEQDHGSPPLGSGPDPRYRPPPAAPSYGPFGAGRDSPETQRRKKEEFLGLCARAWDLFHS